MRARRSSPSARLVAAALLAGAGAACGGDTPTAPTLARLDLVTTSDSVVENESVTWRVTGVSNRDAPIETGTVAWTSSDTTVAAVSPAGVISARQPGQALIVASAGPAHAQATLRVTPGRAVSLTFVTAIDSLPLRSEARFSAQVLDGLGRTLRGRTVAWVATDTTVAVVAADGRVTPRAVGRTQIVATVDSARAAYDLVVREPLAARVSFTRQLDTVYVGQRDSVVAVLLDSLDVPLRTVRPRYSTSDASVLGVDATGHVRGQGTGQATITASGDGRTRAYTLSVLRAPIDHLYLAADTLTLFPGGATALGVSVRDLFGVRVTDRAPSWGVDAPGVVDVDASGQVTARRAGTAVVTATVEKATARVVVRVVEPQAGFQPEVRFVGPTPAPLVEQQIREAMARWQALVVGDLPDVTIGSRDAAFCGLPRDGSPTFVDDLLVVVELDSIDGPGNVLGAAGPCIMRSRTTAGGLTAIGVVTLDSVDVSRLASQGLLVATMQHEIGHILGLGTLWAGYFPLSSGIGGADPRMTGFRSRMAASTIGVTLEVGVGVPLENTGGEGTRDGHWRESVFGDELMTGYIGRTNPLSILSVQAMADLGYLVDVSRTEPYALAAGIPLFGPPGTAPLLVAGTSPLAQLFASPTATGFRDIVLLPEFEADRGGAVRRLVPRPGTESRGAVTWRAARRAAADAARQAREQ